MSRSKTVTLFVQCLVDTIYPEVAEAMVGVFRRLGISLTCPTDQTCCGQPAFNAGYLFENDSQWLRRARDLANRTYEFSEYLVDILGVEELGAHFEGRLTYHDSCHLLRGIGVGEQPRKLLQKVSGAEFIEMRDSDYCCGFGGTFSVKYADVSDAMVTDKAKNIMDTGADVVVGCDMGCLMNIQGKLSRLGSRIKVMHIAQILADARQ
jgi:L-lactate dehydrogenase complex protein LldE